MTPYPACHKMATIMLTSLLLVSCASEKRVSIVDKIQTEYARTVHLNEKYLNQYYGTPDPVSLPRLKRYQYEAYQALMNFREEFNKHKPIPQSSLHTAKQKIQAYRSYLNALGATSATKDNLIGF